jgi:hypothetical protein
MFLTYASNTAIMEGDLSTVKKTMGGEIARVVENKLKRNSTDLDFFEWSQKNKTFLIENQQQYLCKLFI